MLRPSGAMGVRRPDRSVSMGFAGDVAGDPLSYELPDLPLKDLERAAELAEELESIVGRMPPGSFTQDPGMRARDEFTDITSKGYNEWAKRAAENPQKQYATSVEEEGAEARAVTLRNRVGLALATMMGMGVASAAGGVSTTLRNAGMAPSMRNILGGLTNRAGAGAPFRSALHSGRGPGYQAGVARNAGNRAGIQSPMQPQAAQPAVRNFGPPPGPPGSPYTMPGSQPGMGDLKGLVARSLDGGKSAAAIDAAAFGGAMSPMVYDMIQRYKRGARPFGPGR
jgi:hypothetical protein